MADVEVTYRGQIIRSMSASGTEVLHTGGKLCDDDITIDYTSPGGGGANLQTKSVSYTPDETGISDTILPDPGYDGMDEVDVSVAAIPDSYVGSAIPQRDSSDLLVTGRLVRAPAGYYAEVAGAQVSLGTEGTPTASKGAVSNHSVDVTPSVTNTGGWITGSTITGTPVTVSASELVSGSQTITANGTYDVTDLAEAVVNVSGGGVTPTLDTVVYEGLSYRDIFITANQITGFDFENGLPSGVSVAAGAPTLVTEEYSSYNHAIKCFGSTSQQYTSVNTTGVDWNKYNTKQYFIAYRAKCDRYVQGNLGIYNWIIDPVKQVTSGWVTMAAWPNTSGSSYGSRVFGSYTSANLDGYMDDIVYIPVSDLFTVMPVFSQLIGWYETYCQIRHEGGA